VYNFTTKEGFSKALYNDFRKWRRERLRELLTDSSMKGFKNITKRHLAKLILQHELNIYVSQMFYGRSPW
jgi:hypothetical protein